MERSRSVATIFAPAPRRLCQSFGTAHVAPERWLCAPWPRCGGPSAWIGHNTMEGPSDKPDCVVGDPSVPAHTSNATAVQSDARSESQDQVSQSTGDYKIKLEAFEGPLDLLLHLIRKEEMSIYDIQIARITDQYLEYLAAMQNLDIGVAGEFLVLAATLIQIKSQMLLPRDPDAPEGEEEDPRADLVYQLLEHQKFKAAASALHQRATIEAATFTRGPLETDEDNPEVAATVFQLFEVFREVLNRRRAIAELEI